MFQLYLIHPRLWYSVANVLWTTYVDNAGCRTYGGNCFYEVVQLESKQYAGLARVVETQNDHSHLHLGPDVDAVVLVKTDRREERRSEVPHH